MEGRLQRRWSSVEALELGVIPQSRHFDHVGTPLLTRPELLVSSQRLLQVSGNREGGRTRSRSCITDSPRIQSTVGSSTASPRKQSLLPEALYHIYNSRQKRHVVYIVSFAGLFSPLSSNIYFPALGNIAKYFEASNAQVALTITMYMIFQGIAPSFWGSWADSIGRRPVFIGTFAVYLVSNIGLALSPNLSVLMMLRGLQAIGSSATVSIGVGVIADITTAAERGGLIGTFGGIRMLGQAAGPAVGGLLTEYLGFRSIFYFLFALGAVALGTIIVLLPETLRNLAGNGTIVLRGWHRPLSYRIIGLPKPVLEPPDSTARKQIPWKSMFVAPIRMLCEKDVLVTLAFGSVVYAIWSMVTASTTQLFQKGYHLSDLVVGFAFLPNGLGCVLGSHITGRLLDRDFRITSENYWRNHYVPGNVESGVNSAHRTPCDFPFERARLRSIWWQIAIFCASTAAYGFSLSTSLAVPLILQFLIAYSATAIFSSNSTLLVDFWPDHSASATAVNNFARCSVGAISVAVVDIVLARFGVRATFGCLALFTVALTPLVGVEWVWGMGWRMGRDREGEEFR